MTPHWPLKWCCTEDYSQWSLVKAENREFKIFWNLEKKWINDSTFSNINYFSIFENPWKPNNNSLYSPLSLMLFVMIVIVFLGFVKTMSKTSGTTETDTSNSVIKKAKQTCYGWCFWFWNKSTRCREVTWQERQHRSLRCLVF